MPESRHRPTLNTSISRQTQIALDTLGKAWQLPPGRVIDRLFLEGQIPHVVSQNATEKVAASVGNSRK